MRKYLVTYCPILRNGDMLLSEWIELIEAESPDEAETTARANAERVMEERFGQGATPSEMTVIETTDEELSRSWRYRFLLEN